MTFSIGSVSIQVTEEEKGIRLQTDSENILLINQTLEGCRSILENNFEIVKAVFETRAYQYITSGELDEVILKIVLQHFCLYSNWREIYPKERNRDLKFLVEDLENPMTYDAVSHYIKTKYRKRYREISAKLLGIDENKFNDYERARQEFMDRR